MKKSMIVTQCVDTGAAPPHETLAPTIERQRAVSELLRQAYAPCSAEPPQLAFLAQRVLAQAQARPAPGAGGRAWAALRSFFGVHPLWAWSSASAAAALIALLAVVPALHTAQAAPPPVRSFVIYQLSDGSGFIRMLEYEQVSAQESSYDQS